MTVMPRSALGRQGEDFGPCPDCSGSLGITRSLDGHVTSIFHSVPVCSTFDKMDSTAFLLRVLDIREAQRRSPPVDGD